jgi:hypothetical protein
MHLLADTASRGKDLCKHNVIEAFTAVMFQVEVFWLVKPCHYLEDLDMKCYYPLPSPIQTFWLACQHKEQHTHFYVMCSQHLTPQFLSWKVFAEQFRPQNFGKKYEGEIVHVLN